MKDRNARNLRQRKIDFYMATAKNRPHPSHVPVRLRLKLSHGQLVGKT